MKAKDLRRGFVLMPYIHVYKDYLIQNYGDEPESYTLYDLDIFISSLDAHKSRNHPTFIRNKEIFLAKLGYERDFKFYKQIAKDHNISVQRCREIVSNYFNWCINNYRLALLKTCTTLNSIQDSIEKLPNILGCPETLTI